MLVTEGVLSPVKLLEWANPTCAIPKKDQSIWVVTNFWGLKKEIVQKSYPVHPLIQEIIPAIGQFKFATAIYLIMGYYSMELDPKAKQVCLTYLPWIL